MYQTIINDRYMIKAKTMTHWENENYDYPLPDVSHFSKKEAKKLKIRMSINTYPAAIFVRKNFIAAVFCFMQFTSFAQYSRPEWEFLSLLGLYFGYLPFRAGPESRPTVYSFFKVGSLLPSVSS